MFEHLQKIVTHTKEPDKAVLDLLVNTTIGTNGAKYQHLHTATKIHTLHQPHYVTIRRNDKAVGNMTVCERPLLVKEKEIETNIPSEVEYNFGKGEIRVKENGKYYHGIMITECEKYSNLKPDSNHRFFERTDDENVEKWPITTSKHDEYCCNCSLDAHNSKNRRVYNIYVCNGHEYNEF